MPADRDFYEDDEPLEDVLAAFDAGEQGLTAPPSRGRTEFVTFDGTGDDDLRAEMVGNAKSAG